MLTNEKYDSLLKQRYNKYTHEIHKHGQTQESLSWLSGLSDGERMYLQEFEREKHHSHASALRIQSKAYKANYRTVIDHGSGWYHVNLGQPTSDGFSLGSQTTEIRGKKNLDKTLKDNFLWSIVDGEIVGYLPQVNLNEL